MSSRSASSSHVPLVALAAFLMLPGAFAQDGERERFTTGPVVGVAPRDGFPDDFPELPGPPDGNDIKANPVTTSAQNETSFAVDPTDSKNWVGVANDYRFGTVHTGWYSTQDGGQTWSSGTFGVDPGFSFSGDPCVTVDGNGTFVIVCMMYSGPGGSAVKAFRSTDGGQTWNSGTVIDLNGSNDKPQVECDLSGGPFDGDVTTAWDRFGVFGGDSIHVSTSTDGGQTWTSQQQINGGASSTGIGPDVTYGANSALYVVWADRGTFDIWIDRSFDGGATWSADVKVADYTMVPSPLPGSPFRMFDIFAVSADMTSGPHSGNVYVAYHHSNGGGTGQADVRVAVSTDQGASWPTNNKITSDVGLNDQVMPGICVDSKGNVNVAYYDQRLDGADQLLYTWVSRSSDGGGTWVDYPASDVGWNPSPTEFAGTFIGDYIDMECSSRRVHPFWCDGRSGSQDVYTDAMNLDLFTDVDSLSASTGGQASVSINIGPNHAGDPYQMFLGTSGTSPGITIGGVQIPLNPDGFTSFSIAQAGSAFLPGSVGTLDATGSASAGLDTQGPFGGGLAGLELSIVVVVFDGSGNPIHATAPTAVSLVP